MILEALALLQASPEATVIIDAASSDNSGFWSGWGDKNQVATLVVAIAGTIIIPIILWKLNHRADSRKHDKNPKAFLSEEEVTVESSSTPTTETPSSSAPLVVTTSFGLYEPPEVYPIPYDIIVITAHNKGRWRIKLVEPKLLLPGNKTMLPIHPRSRPGIAWTDAYFPFLLGRGRSIATNIRASMIAEVIKGDGHSGRVEIVGVYQTSDGKNYASEPYTLDLDRYSREREVFV